MRSSPQVSIIIPCRNEEMFIGKCLESIIANDYPKEKLEVLVIEGISEDKTKEIVNKYAKRFSFIKLLSNLKKIIPAALNIGIQNANGDIIIRMDAHNVYSKDYISKCVKYLTEYNVDNVGGIWVTLPGNNTIVAESIALALSHPFGVGNAYYRIGLKEPKFVDTVPFGCYKREIFDIIGLYDEDLIRNEDDEFNNRLIKNGCKILLVPDIVSYYYARETLAKLWKMCFQYGYFKPLVAKKSGVILTWRQLIPVLFVGSLITACILLFFSKSFIFLFLLILFSYLITNIGVSLSIAFKKGLKHIFSLPIVFSTLHFSYGYGYLVGIWDFILLKKYKRGKIEDFPLTR
jgi:glycosyltransferase involved in cell wall biosynthesis